MSGMAEVLGDLWDKGNGTGLDGWVGPGRGTYPIDDEAVHARERDIEAAIAVLAAAGFGPVKEAAAKALEDAAEAAADPSPEDMDTYFIDQADVGGWLRARAAAVRGEG